MSATAKMPASPGLPTFYALLLTQGFSLIGSRMTAVAVGIWVFSRTGQTAPLLLAAFFTELPGMLGGSLAGVAVDRWSRKRILLLADLGQAAGSLALLVSFQSGAFQLWHLYLVALVQGAFASLQAPAESATITLLVPDRHRDRANGFQELAFPLAGILAPVFAGLLYAAVGVGGVITVDLATFGVAAAVVLGLRIPQPAPTAAGQAARGGWLAELRGGLRFFRERPALLGFVLYQTFMNFLLNGPLELAVPYFLLVTGSETRTGLALGIMSLGALAGGLLVVALGGRRPRIRLIWMGAVLTGSMFLVFGAARSLPLLGAAIFLLMAPLAATSALFKSILQAKTPPDLQGRVFAVVSQLALAGSTASFLLCGPLVDRVLEPAVGADMWRWVAPVLGSQPGAGIGLLQVMAGLLILAATGLTFSLRIVRTLEGGIPDFEPESARAH